MMVFEVQEMQSNIAALQHFGSEWDGYKIMVDHGEAHAGLSPTRSAFLAYQRTTVQCTSTIVVLER
jgi:hypothetical protein